MKLGTKKKKDQDRGGARAEDVEDSSEITRVVESVETDPKTPTAGDH